MKTDSRRFSSFFHLLRSGRSILLCSVYSAWEWTRVVYLYLLVSYGEMTHTLFDRLYNKSDINLWEKLIYIQENSRTSDRLNKSEDTKN